MANLARFKGRWLTSNYTTTYRRTPLLLPSSLSGFESNLSSALRRDIGHSSFAANFAALLAHLGHDAGDKGAAGLRLVDFLRSDFEVTKGYLIYVFRHLLSRAL